MAQKSMSLSREFIIHPGETLAELLEDRNMNQKDVAMRTGFSEKHISKVINGMAPITANFAKKLQVVFGVEALFWMNLQSNYDLELQEIEEAENITQEEIDALKPLKEISNYLFEVGILEDSKSKIEKVLAFRNFLRLSNLTTAKKIVKVSAYRASQKDTPDPYVLCAWQRLCEIMGEKIELDKELDIEKLKNSIPIIKEIMLEDVHTIQKQLPKIFSKCGIKFCIVRHFKGAPVQGYIEKNDKGEILLCITIRQASADIFWFTLFHEIAHILNNDIKKQFIDYTSPQSKDTAEEKADIFAMNTLLDSKRYQDFISKWDFSLNAIQEYAKEEGVPSCIVIGRLQKEKKIPYTLFNAEKVRWEWV